MSTAHADLAPCLAAARASAAHVSLPNQGRLTVDGAHRERFVHNMTTCPVKGLPAGRAVFGMVVEGQGRLVAQFVLDATDEALVLHGHAERLAAVDAQFRKYRVADRVDFALEGSGEAPGLLAVVGPEAAAKVADVASGVAAAALEPWTVVGAEIAGHAVTCVANPLRGGVGGVDVRVPVGGLEAVEAALAGAGSTALGEDGWAALRVAGGVPEDGVDLTDANVPLESQRLYATIDWDKGCYIGQEVIAMAHYRGRPNKNLVGLALGPGEGLPEAGLQLRTAEGKKAGRLGTVVDSPETGGPAALAIIKRKLAEPGTALTLPDGRGATVVALPFAGPALPEIG